MNAADLIWAVARGHIDPSADDLRKMRQLARGIAFGVVGLTDAGKKPPPATTDHLRTLCKLWKEIGEPECNPATGVGIFAIMAAMAAAGLVLSESEFCCPVYEMTAMAGKASKRHDPGLHGEGCHRVALETLKDQL